MGCDKDALSKFEIQTAPGLEHVEKILEQAGIINKLKQAGAAGLEINARDGGRGYVDIAPIYTEHTKGKQVEKILEQANKLLEAQAGLSNCKTFTAGCGFTPASSTCSKGHGIM